MATRSSSNPLLDPAHDYLTRLRQRSARCAANRLDWRYPTGGWVVSNPSLTVAGGSVYVGSRDDKLYALDANNGNSVWSFPTGASADSRPVVAGGTVYVGSNDDKVYALDTANGNRRWATSIGDFAVSGPPWRATLSTPAVATARSMR